MSLDQTMTDEMTAQIAAGKGFIAALDQSGGSTPKALAAYGIEAEAYGSEAEMFDQIHAMRARIVDAPAFSGDKVVGAILFEMTMDRDFGGMSAPAYLWKERRVVPFLKVDKGLEDAANGVKLMKPIPGLGELCDRAAALGVFGTKMRSVIDHADAVGIKAIVEQQFAFGADITAHGLMPIIEPEVTITAPDKAEIETILRSEILAQLDALPEGQHVMLKLTLPEVDNHYLPLVEHPKVLSVVALSGGYSRAEANARLSKQKQMIASFSRALTEGLSAQQSDDAFNSTIAETIDSIYAASVAG